MTLIVLFIFRPTDLSVLFIVFLCSCLPYACNPFRKEKKKKKTLDNLFFMYYKVYKKSFQIFTFDMYKLLLSSQQNQLGNLISIYRAVLAFALLNNSVFSWMHSRSLTHLAEHNCICYLAFQIPMAESLLPYSNQDCLYQFQNAFPSHSNIG